MRYSFFNKLLIILVLLISYPSFSQDLSIEFGQEFESVVYDGREGFSFLGEDESHYYSISTRNDPVMKYEVMIETIDKELNLVSAYSGFKKPEGASLVHISFAKNKIRCIYSQKDDEKAFMHYSYRTYNPAGKEIENIKLGKIPLLKDGFSARFANYSKSERFVVISQRQTIQKYQKVSTQFLRIDLENPLPVDPINIEQEYLDKKITIETALLVGNNGVVYQIQQTKRQKDWKGHENWLLTINSDFTQSKIIPLKENDVNFWNSAALIDNEKNTLILSGLYTPKDIAKDELFNGFYKAEFSAVSSKIISSELIPIDFEISNFLDHKFEKGDKKLKIEGEYKCEILQSRKGGGYIVFNHYGEKAPNDLIVFHFSQEGGITEHWMLPKYNFGLFGNEYKAYVKDDNLILVYSDHKDNMAVKHMSKAKSSLKKVDSKVIVLAAQINPITKELTKQSLFNTNDKNGYFYTRKALVDKADNLIIETTNKKDHRFIRLK